jgi:hypothetical protein
MPTNPCAIALGQPRYPHLEWAGTIHTGRCHREFFSRRRDSARSRMRWVEGFSYFKL